MKRLKGIAASPGLALGPAFLRSKERTVLPGQGEDPKIEWQRYVTASKQVADHLKGLGKKVRYQPGGGTDIFDAYANMMDDPVLLEKIKDYIFQEKWNVEYAVYMAVETFAGELESLNFQYLAARGNDLREVAQMVIRQLKGNFNAAGHEVSNVPKEVTSLLQPSIITARDLSFLDTVNIERSKVLGYCLSEGSNSGHTAILARASGIPAVVGIGPDVLNIVEVRELLLDGNEGIVIINPDERTRIDYENRKSRQETISLHANSNLKEPAVTRDGFKVKVFANIGDKESTKEASHSGADGVGLFRTEFLYSTCNQLPDEDLQYRVYTRVLSHFKDKPVILRTFDLGGDKTIPFLDLPGENNPFLGLRGIRLSLVYDEVLLKPQLRAAIRAGEKGNLMLMLPMVSCIDEIIAVQATIAECKSQLMAQGYPISRKIPIGIMVETPAAAIMAKSMSEAVDFFSIGTNDLTQYTMAADRTNPAVSNLISGFQPAVLDLVHHIVQGGKNNGKPVGVCGELAGEPLAIPLLIGLGIRELSVNPRMIPITKHIIRQLTLRRSQEIANQAMKMNNPEEVRVLVKKKIKAISKFLSNNRTLKSSN